MRKRNVYRFFWSTSAFLFCYFVSDTHQEHIFMRRISQPFLPSESCNHDDNSMASWVYFPGFGWNSYALNMQSIAPLFVLHARRVFLPHLLWWFMCTSLLFLNLLIDFHLRCHPQLGCFIRDLAALPNPCISWCGCIVLLNRESKGVRSQLGFVTLTAHFYILSDDLHGSTSNTSCELSINYT